MCLYSYVNNLQRYKKIGIYSEKNAMASEKMFLIK